MKKRLISLALAFCLILSYPLQCSALGFSDYFKDSYDNLIDYVTYLEEQAVETIKTTYDSVITGSSPDVYDSDSIFPDWLDGFHKIDNSDWGVPSDPSLGIGSSSGSGGSGGCNLIHVPYGSDDYYFCEHSPDLNCALTLSSILYPNSAGKIIVALPDFSTYIIINFSKSPESDNCHVLSSTSYYGVLDLFLNGSYNGDVSFTVADCCSYKDRGFTQNPFPQYSNYFTHRIHDWTNSIGYADFYKLIRNFSGSSDRYLAYTDFPIYDRYTNDLVNEGQPTLDFDSSFSMHPFSKATPLINHYLLDINVWYTGDSDAFDADSYTVSAGLLFNDSSTGSNYLPCSDYVFFDRFGYGKVSTLDSPSAAFHMPLTKVKDWITKKQLGYGDFYAFACVTDDSNDTVYYNQIPLDFSNIDSGLYSDLADFPDWDDYCPDNTDSTQTPTITINNYNDYDSFESAPNSFDFDAYAQWMYTNLSVMNNNIGTLNDNLILFFNSFEDFAGDFYSYFNSKFSHLFSLIGNVSASFADYLKDTCKTIVFNMNVITDNMLSELKSLFKPDDTDVSFILSHFLPWYKDLTGAFGQLMGNSSSSGGPQLISSNGSRSSPSDALEEGFSIYLPVGYDGNLWNQVSGQGVVWEEKYLPIETFYNEDVYNMITYIIYAIGFFTCIRLGYSILGIGFNSAISSELDSDASELSKYK